MRQRDHWEQTKFLIFLEQNGKTYTSMYVRYVNFLNTKYEATVKFEKQSITQGHKVMN